MRILVTGSLGQLGAECVELFSAKHDVVGVDLPRVNIISAVSLGKGMVDFQPEVIINCAAFTRVDDCESERDLARQTNVEGVRNLVNMAGRYGARLIHISTDYVFDGRRALPEPYCEDDETGPATYYGQTKLESEKIVRQAGGQGVVLRTAWLYGIHGGNFLKSILRKATAFRGEPLRVVSDQYGGLTWAYRLARQIERVMEDKKCAGIYHATAEGYASWYEVARRFLELMGVECRIEPCATSEYPRPAMRPLNSILENQRLKESGLNVMVDWQSDLEEFVACNRGQLLAEAAG